MAKDKVSDGEKAIDKYINDRKGKLTPKEAASLASAAARLKKERLGG